MRNDEVIAATDLAAGYADHAVWEGATFSFGHGAFIGVLGPNGSGKTTLFRLLLGLVKPLRGALSVFGKAAVRGNPRIGYVPQRHAIESEMGIEALELVRFGLIGNRSGIGWKEPGREEALSALRSVGAEKLAHRPLGALSGGELQAHLFGRSAGCEAGPALAGRTAGKSRYAPRNKRRAAYP